MKIFHQWIAVCLLCFPFIITAQQIQTDRPNETEGPNAVPKHRLQLENGFSFEQEDGEKTFEVPEIVLRYGLFKNFEVRLENAFQITPQEDKDQYGIKPVVIGAKYHILDHKNAVPDIGILARVSIPWMADNAYQEQKYSPEVRLLVQHQLSKSSHLGYNLGVHWQQDDLQPEYIYTLSADHSISKKVKLVIETYGFALPHHHAANNADASLLFLITNKLQLDLMAGTSLMHAHSKKFAAIGMSFEI
jgi:hypothetical protein